MSGNPTYQDLATGKGSSGQDVWLDDNRFLVDPVNGMSCAFMSSSGFVPKLWPPRYARPN